MPGAHKTLLLISSTREAKSVGFDFFFFLSWVWWAHDYNPSTGEVAPEDQAFKAILGYTESLRLA